MSDFQLRRIRLETQIRLDFNTAAVKGRQMPKAMKVIEVRNITQKPIRRAGQVYTFSSDSHYHADIVANKSIRIFGAERQTSVRQPLDDASPIGKAVAAAYAERGERLANLWAVISEHHTEMKNPEALRRVCRDLVKMRGTDLIVQHGHSRSSFDAEWDVLLNHICRWEPQFVPFDRTFSIGDTVEHDSYNLVYTGEITAIGQKTVAVNDHGKTVRLDLYTFIRRNWDLDLDKIAERNADTLMHI